jgi:3-oxoadipate enol-lactonase
MRFRYLEALPPPGARPRGVLILLHAFPLNARMWEPQLALAEHGWHVIAPHFRCFDTSDGGPPASSVDDYAGDVIDLLDALHIHDAVVGGLSMGGYVAFAVLRHAASYIRALILADTKATADTPEGVEGRLRMLQLLVDKGVSAIADEMIPKLLAASTVSGRPDVVDWVGTMIRPTPPPAISGAIRALMSRPDSTPLLSMIHVPTLVVVGEEDTLTPPAMSEEIHRGIAGSELVRIAGAGHLSNLEQPKAFNDALAHFLTHRV